MPDIDVINYWTPRPGQAPRPAKVGFQLRLDPGLHAALKRAAGNRSLNTEICERLERSLLADDLRQAVREEIRLAMNPEPDA